MWQWSLVSLEPECGNNVSKQSIPPLACISMIGNAIGMGAGVGRGGAIHCMRAAGAFCVTRRRPAGAHTTSLAFEICGSLKSLSRMSGDFHDSALQTTIDSKLPCGAGSFYNPKGCTCLETVPP